MRRVLFRVSVGLAAFAVSYFAAASFERAVSVPADLVAAPVVEELKSTPAPQPRTCRLHGMEMRPFRVGIEPVAVYSQNWQYAVEESKGENRRRFPNYLVVEKTEEKDAYGEIYLLHRCDRCDAAYRAWDRRHAGEP